MRWLCVFLLVLSLGLACSNEADEDSLRPVPPPPEPFDPRPAPPPAFVPATGSGCRTTCRDFACQQDAQDFFLRMGGPAMDPCGLDRDRNGVACEEIPRC
jgi:hypothetical protein